MIVWDSKPSRKEDPINWVELKTTAELFNDKEKVKYERKLLKFWAQSFLLGVPKIVVGFRDKAGMLLRLEELETHGIPGKVKREGRGSWDGNICINFTAAFLECKICLILMQQNMANRADGFRLLGLKTVVNTEGTWRIRKRERSPVIEVFRIEESGHGDILSSNFTEWRAKQ